MTIDTVPAAVPGVFDAGLPSLDYLQVHDPEDAHRAIADRAEQRRSPSGRSGPRCSPTTWSARCCATRGSPPRGSPAPKPKASPQGRCGTGSPT